MLRPGVNFFAPFLIPQNVQLAYATPRIFYDSAFFSFCSLKPFGDVHCLRTLELLRQKDDRDRNYDHWVVDSLTIFARVERIYLFEGVSL